VAAVDYLDFELEIGPGAGREYPLAVLRSPGGEAQATLRFPFDELALKNHLLALENALLRSGGRRAMTRRVLAPPEESVQAFGRALFEALFAGQVATCYARSRERAAGQGKGLRLKRIEIRNIPLLDMDISRHT
jgi:hypothetical protein